MAHKRQEVAEAKKARPISQLERALKGRPPVRDFRKAIHREGNLSLIAEVKRASPSVGPIRPGAVAAEVASTYALAGAQAISVLTDAKFFQGSLKDLTQVKEKVSLPVLRKDFTLEEYQVVEAAAAGADAVLLIAAILQGELLTRLIRFSGELGMSALVETHTEREMGDALEAGARVMGINNRNLDTFEVDLATTRRLIGLVPKDRTVVSESGIHSRADVEWIERLGAHAVLIGEELMSSEKIEQRVKELMGW